MGLILFHFFIDTTDVQKVSAVVLGDQHAFIVQCEFIIGSDAQGCLVILVGESDNVTLYLTRSSKVTLETVMVTNPPSSYSKVLAFDVECDGSVGTLAILGDIVLTNKGLYTCITYC